MKRKWFAIFIFALTICLPLATVYAATAKYLIVLQTGMETREGASRALHALLYAKELKEHGHEVVLVFDGTGIEWVHEWTNPDSKNELLPLFKEVRKKAVTWIVCDYCAAAYNAKKDLEHWQVPLTSEYEGHPSVAQWADQGYQIIVL